MSSDQPPAVTARHNSPDLSRRRMAEDAARVPELLPIRYARMALSPFSFFRGSAAVMAADLTGTPSPGRRCSCAGTRTCPTSGPSPRRSDDSCSTSTTSTRRCRPVGVGRDAAGGEHRGRGSRVAGRGSRARVRGVGAGRRRGGSRPVLPPGRPALRQYAHPRGLLLHGRNGRGDAAVPQPSRTQPPQTAGPRPGEGADSGQPGSPETGEARAPSPTEHVEHSSNVLVIRRIR